MSGVTFFVPGTPAPKGSPRIVTRGRGGKPLPFPRVLKDSAKTESWESVVAQCAALAMRGRPKFEGVALYAEITFGVQRPDGHYGSGRNADRLRPAAPLRPAVKPDWDKLGRSTGDALEGIVYDNDSRLVTVIVRKVYAGRGEPTGAVITVEPARGDDSWGLRVQLAADCEAARKEVSLC